MKVKIEFDTNELLEEIDPLIEVVLDLLTEDKEKIIGRLAKYVEDKKAKEAEESEKSAEE